jgi:glyoxylase-like metal-dependent hydrolase (beta-lactamase superfamily II)
MAKMDEFKDAKAKFLPKKTYKETMTIGTGKDEIDLYYFGPGHTNGDTFVVFTQLRTMHVGDIFAWKALPYVDADNGGSVMQQGKSLSKAVATVKNVDTIINGHIPVSTWNDLKEYAQFTSEFAAFAEAQMKAGKTSAQAADAYKLDPKYKGYLLSVNPALGARANMDIAFNEMKK